MLVTSFNSGELSPTLAGRIDLAVYAQGAARLENFEIIPTGGIRRRTGTRRLGTLGGPARIIPFTVNASTTFILEIGIQYIRVWQNGEPVLLNGAPLQFLPIEGMPLYGSIAEALEVQYAQTYDQLWLVHKNYPPYVFRWAGGTTFTLELPRFTGNAGAVPFSGSGKYPGSIAFFLNRLFLASSLEDPQRIWASKTYEYQNFTTFDTVETLSTKLRNPLLQLFTATATADSPVLTAVSQDVSGTENLTDFYVSGDGIPIGTKILSATGNSITLTKNVTDTAENAVFSMQLWADPATPTAADYEDVTTRNDVTGPAHAFTFEVASDKNDAIRWLAAKADLIIGTESSEWVVPASVNATSVQAVLNSRTGSAPLQPTVLGPAVIFFQQGGKALREYYYTAASETYQSFNLASWAEHILQESAAVDYDFTANPYLRVIITRADGNVAVLLYERDMAVMGWYRISISGARIKSTATAPTNAGTDDIYFVVERNSVYYLEVFQSGDGVYLDSRTAMTGLEGLVISSYGEAAMLYNVRSGASCPKSTIPTGFALETDEIHIGYPYESIMESMPVVKDAANAQKRIVSLMIRFLNSCIPAISNPQTNKEETQTAEEPFSGVLKIPFAGSFDRDVAWRIRSTKPGPCTVLSVFAQIQ